jgi:hypothetical protein
MGRVLVTWAASALWWLADHIWGDRFWAFLSPMIPLSVVNYTPSLATFVTYGPPIFLLLLGFYFWLRQRKKGNGENITSLTVNKEPNDVAESYGTVRVADHPAVVALFKGRERDKLIPLLEAERISAWGRKPTGNPAPTKIPGRLWASHYLHYVPRDETGINQTYFRPNNRYETIFFDVHLNKIQIERIWPGIAEPTPLEILFDLTNPNQKFWSIEQARDENGKQIEGSYWEYRAMIKNQSAKTLRNVKVTVEAIGQMPRRPEPSYFDINKKPLIDLTPREETLAIVRRWYHPHIVAGMVIGEGIYGPIKVTASADDVPPATKCFQFDPSRNPMREPAIYEMIEK